jgi:hypothetical protein
MSQPEAPPPVPYGPGADAPAPVAATNDVAARTAGRTAVKWGVRILLPIVLRAAFRALSRR